MYNNITNLQQVAKQLNTHASTILQVLPKQQRNAVVRVHLLNTAQSLRVGNTIYGEGTQFVLCFTKRNSCYIVYLMHNGTTLWWRKDDKQAITQLLQHCII